MGNVLNLGINAVFTLKFLENFHNGIWHDYLYVLMRQLQEKNNSIACNGLLALSIVIVALFTPT